MALKIKVVRTSLLEHPVRNIILLVLGGTLLLGLVVCESIFGYYYFKYRHIVDERLQKPLFEQTAKIYAAPKEVARRPEADSAGGRPGIAQRGLQRGR